MTCGGGASLFTAMVVPIGTNCRTGWLDSYRPRMQAAVARMARAASLHRIDLHRTGWQHPGAKRHARPLVSGDELGLFSTRPECASAVFGEDEALGGPKALWQKCGSLGRRLAIRPCLAVLRNMSSLLSSLASPHIAVAMPLSHRLGKWMFEMRSSRSLCMSRASLFLGPAGCQGKSRLDRIAASSV